MSNPRSFDLVLGGKDLLPETAAVLGGIEGFMKIMNLEMAFILGGTFLMGSSECDDEKPQHRVTIQPFYMGKYAATQAQWKAVAQLPKIERDLDPDPSRFKGDNRPVERVSWLDAVEFCARLSQKTGRNYRLPSEAEWEYACKAGTQTPFHFGETITPDLANYDGNENYTATPNGKYRQQTTGVGSFPPNTFGLYDMHGNVWEWCADPWHDNYNGAPTDGSVWDEKENHRYQNSVDSLAMSGNDDRIRLLRGGSWFDGSQVCRSAMRNNYMPDTPYYCSGFRFVCVAESEPNPQISTTNSTVCGDNDFFESFVTDYYDE
jgi:formylglycine-generating enzyme required for sulfatase activity